MTGLSIYRKSKFTIVESHDIKFQEWQAFGFTTWDVEGATNHLAHLNCESNGGPNVVEFVKEGFKHGHIFITAEHVVNISQPQGRPHLHWDFIHENLFKVLHEYVGKWR